MSHINTQERWQRNAKICS